MDIETLKLIALISGILFILTLLFYANFSELLGFGDKMNALTFILARIFLFICLGAIMLIMLSLLLYR